MRAFIVRPFGQREGINFDKVQETLIDPALTHQNIDGGTTGLILEAGNIREDMFQQLLVADFVVADVSIHNANVFYELGIRHALQPRHTFLIRAKVKKPKEQRGPQDEIPFDLRTDRYLEYDPDDPAATLPMFIRAIAETKISKRQDSPVFLLLPNLKAQDRSQFLTVPLEFGEEVERAARGGHLGKLSLLGLDARGQTWESEGLRLVGREQFNCEEYSCAKVTWESVRDLDSFDVEANLMLGTIYQKLQDLESSNQALGRVVNGGLASQKDRAEALSLLARNIKVRWRRSWESIDDPAKQRRKALRSPDLIDAYEKYHEAYKLDLNHFYSGLNALSLLTIGIALAKDMPEVFNAPFSSDEKAKSALEEYESERQKVAGAVQLSIDAMKSQNVLKGVEDTWTDISEADLCFLTSDRPGQVEFLYERVLVQAKQFHIESMRGQLRIFEQLKVLDENVKAALGVFPADQKKDCTKTIERVLLFTGHMIDQPDRAQPRFPATCVPTIREAIREAVKREIDRANGGAILGLAGGASGSDLLFHEVCEELGVKTELYLALPPNVYRTQSVDPAGREWIERFDHLLERIPEPPVLSRAEQPPAWLISRQGYAAWQRANLWLLSEALIKGARNLQVIAVWDGEAGDGPGGTEHLFRIARDNGAGTVHLNTNELLGMKRTCRAAASK